MMVEVVVTIGVDMQIVTTNKPTPAFYWSDALPVAKPTVSKH